MARIEPEQASVEIYTGITIASIPRSGSDRSADKIAVKSRGQKSAPGHRDVLSRQAADGRGCLMRVSFRTSITLSTGAFAGSANFALEFGKGCSASMMGFIKSVTRANDAQPQNPPSKHRSAGRVGTAHWRFALGLIWTQSQRQRCAARISGTQNG